MLRRISNVTVIAPTAATSARSYWLYASYNAARHMDRKGGLQKRYGAPQAQLQVMLREKRLLGSKATTAGTTSEGERRNPDAVRWDASSSADIVALTTATRNQGEDSVVQGEGGAVSNQAPLRVLAKHPFVPLAQCAKIELSGDYCFEGGRYRDALEHYGVVAKAFKAAFPEHHNMQAGIALKLARAFRCVSPSSISSSSSSLLQAAEFNALRSLEIFDKVANPCVELIAEAFIELGKIRALTNSPEAGELFEDSLTLLNNFHDIGLSSRLLKHFHFSSSRNHMDLGYKFAWFSPYDFDRVFALVDTALELAEGVYRKQGNQEGVVRVLEAKTELVDRKYFNMRNDAGKIGRNHAQWRTRARNHAETPTATDLLTYTPTVHQIYRDYSLENTAPLDGDFDTQSGQQVLPGDRVQQGGNRRVVDDGDPLRFKMAEKKEEARRKATKPLYDEKELLRW